MTDDDGLKRSLLIGCGFSGMTHVIDYGCGNGPWIWPLLDLCKTVTGVDCNAEYLHALEYEARKRGVSVKTVQAVDLRSLPSVSADGIICIGTLPVVQHGALWHDFFEQAHRILRPHGRILFNTFAPEIIYKRLREMEAVTYIRRKGLGFALDRQLGALRLLATSMRGKVSRHRRYYYALRPQVIESFIREKGFEVLMDPGTIAGKLPVYLLRSYPDRNPSRPQYLWWLVTKR